MIGIDGVRSDALQAAETAAIDALIADGVVSYDGFAGGELDGATQQATLSGPGWSTILTGVWIDKHGVRANAFVGSQFDEYPHFFQRIREQNPDAVLSSFVTWTPIHDEILAPGTADVAFSPSGVSSAEADVEVTAAVVAHLGARTPDVVFVHLDETDAAGHRTEFSPGSADYVSAIETADGQVGEMVAALEGRATFKSEDWLIIIVTDHGGLDNFHGGQSAEERLIPLVVSGGASVAGSTISPGPGHQIIPPTVFAHLGLPIDPSWGWAKATLAP